MNPPAQFKSADYALAWTFNVLAHPIVNISSVHRMIGGGRSAPAMTPQEKHAQAALIVALMQRTLNAPELAYVKARWGKDGGDLDAILIPWLAAGLPTAIHNRRALRAMILDYLGVPIGSRELGRMLGCGKDAALARRRAAFERMDGLHRVVAEKVEREMVGAGVVG